MSIKSRIKRIVKHDLSLKQKVKCMKTRRRKGKTLAGLKAIKYFMRNRI